MDTRYFNHSSRILDASSRWDRRQFLHVWWRLHARDPRWAPPFYPARGRALDPGRNPDLRRRNPTFALLEAIPRSQTGIDPLTRTDSAMPSTIAMERPVATVLALRDPDGPRAGNATFSHLACVNDQATFDRLLDEASMELRQRGFRRLVGPTGLSPHLETGMLEDHWDEIPPQFTAYNPPFLPEFVATRMQPRHASRLYRFDGSQPIPDAEPPNGIAIQRGKPGRFQPELYELLPHASFWEEVFGAPAGVELDYLTDTLGRVDGWILVAASAGKPVGLLWAVPDRAPLLRRTGGGRSPWGRIRLALGARLPSASGRICFCGALPDWREKGIRRALLATALHRGREQGWKSVNAGPAPAGSSIEAVLRSLGGEPRQSYTVYDWEIQP